MRLCRPLVLPVLVVLAAIAAACSGGGAATEVVRASATATSASTPISASTSVAATGTATPPAVTFSGGPSKSFPLSGLVNTSGTYQLSDLQALPQSTVSTNAKAGNSELGLHEYGGPLLVELLNKAGVKVDTSRPNNILRKAVVVHGSDGYSTAIAWGEIDPRYGNKKVLLALQRDGQPIPEADGFARLIMPGDLAAGRYISNVATIEVKDVGAVPVAGERKTTTSFEVTGLVDKGGMFDAATLGALKQTTVTVETKDASGAVTGKAVYGGVLLNDLLTATAVKLNDKAKNDILGIGIVGIGADGYSSLIAGGEVDPKFANQQILIATSKDGQPLAAVEGFARIVVPGDLGAGRYVSNLAKLEVVRLN